MPTLETPLSKKLGLKYPIVTAPMFIISNKEMILAAAEAGILGTMPAFNKRTPAGLREDLEWIRAKTDKPFGINITIKLTDASQLEEYIELLLEFEVPVIVTSYGDPSDIVRRAHEKGLTVFHDVINLRHALKAQGAGVDGIIAVAAGAGGHAGTTNPYVLFPYLRDHLEVPILAAGCHTSGEHLAASLAMGAQMIYMGTRFIACTECAATDEYKELSLNGTLDDVVYTDKISGTHGNFLKQTVPGYGDPNKAAEGAKKWKEIWSAGQGVALPGEVKPLGEIVEDIIREYADVRSKLPRLEGWQ